MSETVVEDDQSADSEQDARLGQLERDVAKYRVSRDAWTFVIFGIAILGTLAAVIGLIVALTDDDGGDGGDAAAGGVDVDVTLSEFAIELSTDQVATAGNLRIRNAGTMAHNVGVRDTDLLSSDLGPGELGELDISGLEPGTYELYCDIPGHASSGMVATLTVGSADGETAAADASAEHAGHELSAAAGAAMDQTMLDSFAAFPAETEGVGNVPLEPEILADGTKRFELTAAITDWEVSPGNVVQAWTYNGTVPGPRIDLEVGDNVQVELTNELPFSTDIHWHGLDVPNDQDGVAPLTQDIVAPGDSYTYEFTVTERAVAMYHPHAHAYEALPNGMFGTIFVGEMPLPTGQTVSGIEIPEDLVLAQDFPMVVNDAGLIGLTLDGKSFPATTPITASVGDWIQVSYYNEGLQIHPMHLHGFEQIVIAKDGEPLDHPYAADTVLVAPGERYTVLVHADAPGVWVWHCHILNHAEGPDGMFGMVTALIVS
jgi:uncharacterized cupredoxin-like copper-binding protein